MLLRLQLRSDIIQRRIRRAELSVEMQQFPARISKEQPAGRAVVEGAQVQEQHECRTADEPPMSSKQACLMRRQEAQLAGKPGDQQEDGDSGEEGACWRSSTLLLEGLVDAKVGNLKPERIHPNERVRDVRPQDEIDLGHVRFARPFVPCARCVEHLLKAD